MKRKNDAEIEDFLEWETNEMERFEAKITQLITSLVETPLFVATYPANKFDHMIKKRTDMTVEMKRNYINVEMHSPLV